MPKVLQLPKDDNDRIELTCYQGALYHDLGSISRAIAAYGAALADAGEDGQRVQAWIGLAGGMRSEDRYTDALKVLDKAEPLATRHGMKAKLMEIHYMRGNLHFPIGDSEGCLREHNLALKLAQEIGSTEYEARAYSGLGDANYLSGRAATAFDYFNRCVEIARANGMNRIEVTNRHMCGWTRIWLNQFEEALSDADEVVELAAKLNHPRAEMLAHALHASIRIEYFAQYEEARPYLEKCLELARGLKAKRFEAQYLTLWAMLEAARGEKGTALAFCREALDIARATGLIFIGPYILVSLARFADDPKTRKEAMEEAEGLLRKGGIATSIFRYYRDATLLNIEIGDWDRLERYATELEDYTRPEPLPFTGLIIRLSRALAVWGRDGRDKSSIGRLRDLREEALRIKFLTALPHLDRVLGEG